MIKDKTDDLAARQTFAWKEVVMFEVIESISGDQTNMSRLLSCSSDREVFLKLPIALLTVLSVSFDTRLIVGLEQ